MPRVIGVEERRRRLGARHHLARRGDDLVGVAGDLVGLHATDPVSIFLSARARVGGLAPATLERALYEDRSLVRMLAMRRTLFVIPTAIVPVVQAASSDAVAAAERKRLAKLLVASGLAPDGDRWIEELGAAALRALEAGGEATAGELASRVPALGSKVVLAAGKPYEATVSIGSRLLTVLAAEGKIVRGRPRGSWISTQHRWAPAAAGPAVPAPQARRRLLCRWLRAFGPATEADVAWWTGWTLAQTRAALTGAEAVVVGLGGGTEGFVMPEDVEPEPEVAPWVALLPALDATPMGWAGRHWYLGAHKAALFDTNGNVGPTIWCDGRIVGGWAHRPDGRVVARLLEDIGAEAHAAIAAEAIDVEKWLGDVRFTPRFRTPLERELCGAGPPPARA